MKIFSFAFLLICLAFSNAYAQSPAPCPCCTENHQAFDFWVGDWTVYDKTGKVIGTNNVLKMQNDCVLQENWVASNPSYTGTSYNYFDASDSTWNQVWISNSGNVLNLKGKPTADGVMVLRSELVEGPKGNYYNQITWTKNSDGSVTQLWSILDENGQAISQAFEGIYRKAITKMK